MKRIPIRPVLTIQGRPLRIPDRDASGDVIWLDERRGQPRARDADTPSVIQELILRHPVSGMARQDAIHGARLYEQVWTSLQKNGATYLEMEDAEYDWLHKKLADDRVGVQVFGMNLPLVEEALEAEREPSGRARRGPREVGGPPGETEQEGSS